MSTIYLYRSAIIVPAAMRAAANAIAPSVTGNSADAANTYSIALSPGGTGDATHYACCTAVDAEMLAVMQATLEAGDLPGVMYYRWLLSTNALMACSSETATIGAAWGWAQTLADAGLAVIPPPLPEGVTL